MRAEEIIMGEAKVGEAFITHEFDESIAIHRAIVEAEEQLSKSHPAPDAKRAIKAELAGGADFAEIAKAKSTDTGSGAQGGDLGWFGLGVMVQPFEEAVVAAKVGEVAGPVKSDFGYHLILVKETRAAANPPLDEIRDELAAEIENAAIEAKIAELTKTATITREGEAIDPAILKNSALID